MSHGFFHAMGDASAVLSLPDLAIHEVNAAFGKEVVPADMAQGQNFINFLVRDDNKEDVRAQLSAIEGTLKFKCAILHAQGQIPYYKTFTWTATTDGTYAYLIGRPPPPLGLEQQALHDELVDFFDNAPIAMHWLNREGIIVWANKTEMDTLGYTKEEYIGQNVMKFCPDEKELVLKMFASLGTGSTVKDVPVRFRAKDGSIKHLLIDSNVKWKSVEEGAKRVFDHTRCFIRDDTRRKIREREIVLEEKAKAARLMYQQINHDLRTPLQCIIGYSDLMLREGTLQLSHSEHLGVVKDSATQMVNIVNEVLDMSDGASRVIQAAPLDLHQTMWRAADTVRLTAKKNGTKMEVALDEQLPRCVVGDQQRMRRLAVNLLGNAVKFTKGGSVTLFLREIPEAQVHRAAPPTESLTFYTADKKEVDNPLRHMAGVTPTFLQMEVRDTGVGMLPEECEKLFKPFAQANEDVKGTFGGTGLGLYICKQFTEEMGGSIRVTSEKGVGTSFFAEFRIGKDPTLSLQSPMSPEKPLPMPVREIIADHGLRALVVDDVMCNCLLMERLLTAAGVNDVTYVTTGQEALSITATERFDMVFIDIFLPGMSGLEVAQRLRRREKYPKLMAVSGQRLGRSEHQKLFHAHLMKPVSRTKLQLSIASQFKMKLDTSKATPKRGNGPNQTISPLSQHRSYTSSPQRTMTGHSTSSINSTPPTPSRAGPHDTTQSPYRAVFGSPSQQQSPIRDMPNSEPEASGSFATLKDVAPGFTLRSRSGYSQTSQASSTKGSMRERLMALKLKQASRASLQSDEGSQSQRTRDREQEEVSV